MLHNPFGIATAIFVIFFFPAVGTIAAIRNWRAFAKLKAAHQVAPIDFSATLHVHEIDAERSNITLTDNGAIFCRCCLAGCEEGVFIGADVAALWRTQQMPAQPVGARAFDPGIWHNRTPDRRYPWI
jgi:hypothetical protein